MAWLLSEAHVLASADVASDRRGRRKGLLGQDRLEGALVLEPCRWVHTFGMRFDLDVAYVAADGTVLKTVYMRRNRLGAPTRRAQLVIEAEAGAFARWGLRVGDTLEVRHDEMADDANASEARADPEGADSTR